MPLRLLKTWTEEPELEVFHGTSQPDFAILSHRWLAGEEVSLAELPTAAARSKLGWNKIMQCRRLAHSEGFKYVWIDTCCIDKSSSAELTEALNSMFRWYKTASRCYAYLSDVHDELITTEATMPDLESPNAADDLITLVGDAPQLLQQRSSQVFASSPATASLCDDLEQDLVQSSVPKSRTSTMLYSSEISHRAASQSAILLGLPFWTSFCTSSWFTRGWTLQEMLAPSDLVFYNAAWNRIGGFNDVIDTNTRIGDCVSAVTGIDRQLLFRQRTLNSYGIAQKMSWAAARHTERIEDEAYSLIGIFDVSLPIIYGEGRRAFQRLQEELLSKTTDATIFAWDRQEQGSPGGDWRQVADLLAESPKAFAKSSLFVPFALSRPMFRVNGQAVHFDTRRPPDKWYSIVDFVLCTTTDKSTIVTMRAIRMGGLMFACASKLTTYDIYEATVRKFKHKISLEVQRSAGQSGSVQSHHLILCRSPRNKVTFSSESTHWDPQRRCFEHAEQKLVEDVTMHYHGHSATAYLSVRETPGLPTQHELENGDFWAINGLPDYQLTANFEYHAWERLSSLCFILARTKAKIAGSTIFFLHVKPQRVLNQQIAVLEVHTKHVLEYLPGCIGLGILGVLTRLLFITRDVLAIPQAATVVVGTIWEYRESRSQVGTEVIVLALAVALPIMAKLLRKTRYPSEEFWSNTVVKQLLRYQTGTILTTHITLAVLCISYLCAWTGANDPEAARWGLVSVRSTMWNEADRLKVVQRLAYSITVLALGAVFVLNPHKDIALLWRFSAVLRVIVGSMFAVALLSNDIREAYADAAQTNGGGGCVTMQVLSFGSLADRRSHRCRSTLEQVRLLWAIM